LKRKSPFDNSSWRWSDVTAFSKPENAFVTLAVKVCLKESLRQLFQQDPFEFIWSDEWWTNRVHLLLLLSRMIENWRVHQM
jgi:hypothetical protein